MDLEPGGFENVESSPGRAVCAVASGGDAFDPSIGSMSGLCRPETVYQPRAVYCWTGSLDEAKSGGFVVYV